MSLGSARFLGPVLVLVNLNGQGVYFTWYVAFNLAVFVSWNFLESSRFWW